MNREAVARLSEEYRRRGVQLHELMRVDRTDLVQWIEGARIPAARLRQLEWWESSLRAQMAIEASGLPQCPEMTALDEKVQEAVRRGVGLKDLNRVSQAALDHAGSCDLCKKREAVRLGAGPQIGEPFPGYRRAFAGEPEKVTAGLWFTAVAGFSVLGAIYLGVEGMDDPRVPWVFGWTGLVMPWIARLTTRSNTARRWGSYLCVVAGLCLLASTDFDRLRWWGWPVFVVPGAIAVLLAWAQVTWGDLPRNGA